MLRFKKSLMVAVIMTLAALLIYVIIDSADNDGGAEYISYNEFRTMAEEGLVAGVALSDGASLSFTDRSGEEFITNNPRNPLLKENLLMMGISVTEEAPADNALGALGTMLFMALIIFFVIRMTGKSGGKVMAMDIEDAHKNKSSSILFDDIAGNDEAKDSVTDIIDFIKEPERFAKYGARMPRGVIFYGPPGTGKTLMAKAIAGEAGVPFYAVSGSDFVQMYVGVGAARVRSLFKKAREAGRAVIFIDEVDALAKRRSGVNGGNGGSDERDQTLNALLTEMSGFTSSDAKPSTDGIVVIAATNRLDVLDEALLRPGRFDRQVEIALPDLNGRERILRLHSKNKPLSEGIDIPALARATVYFSGAMLENLMNEAAIQAARKGQGIIDSDDMDDAYYSIIAGKAKKDRSAVKEREKRVTAFHEAGHALIAKLLSPENTVAKVTIIPGTKGAGGFCVNIPPDKLFFTKKELEAQIMVRLAGRAAEEIICGFDHVTTGASNDLEQAHKLTYDFIAKYGMNESTGLAPLGEEEIKKEQAALLARLYGETKGHLAQNEGILKRIANALLLKESINESELDALVEGRL